MRWMLMGLLLLTSCGEREPAPECTPEWRQIVNERLAALERGVSDLEQWRWQQDGGVR